VNDGFTYRETINQRGAGRPLDQYMADRYRHTEIEAWRGHIRGGRVRVGGAVAAPDVLLQLGDPVTWHRPPWREPAAPLAFSVLYEEGGAVVVDKPSGLPTMPGGGFLQHTLVHQLRGTHPDAAPMHRLGRWTSGAVLCARSQGEGVGAHIAAQFVARSVGKRYRAWASGRPPHEEFEIDLPIGPVPYPPLGTLHAASPDGRPSFTRVIVVERRADSFLCDVRIATGRPHQIRIHLAAAGFPLVGDPLYVAGGGPRPDGTALPGDPGYHLHAAEITFDHPRTRARVTVCAPVPEALRVQGGEGAGA
jgi:23S rRNA pseudouridine1911/1915/1917 synthase